MYVQQTTVVNPTGLHARPAAEFCKIAGNYKATITVKRLTEDPKEGNGKSVISIMTLCLPKGTAIEISADGEDEQEAVKTLTALVESGFGEN